MSIGHFISVISGADAAENAAHDQAQAAQKAIDWQREAFNKTAGYLEPYRNKGSGALRSFADMYGLGPNGGKAFNQKALNDFYNSPDYRVALQQGIAAQDKSAAARGDLLSGGHMKGLADYASTLATEKFGNYMNNLYRLAGLGENAAAGTGNAAMSSANQLGNYALQQGDANAAGDVGRYNAYSSLFGNVANAGLKLAGY